MIQIGVQDILNGVALPDGKPTRELLRLLQSMIDALNDDECCVENRALIDALQVQVDALSATVDDLSDDVSGLESDRTIMQGQIADLQSDVADLQAGNRFLPEEIYAVADLPPANSFPYYRAMVQDEAVGAFRLVASGGGTIIAPVYSDGTDWRLG